MANCPECNEPKKLRNVKGASWKVVCACPDLSDFTPTTPATIIVLSKHPEIFSEFKKAADKFAPHNPKILVRDGHDIMPPSSGNWKTIQAPEDKKFVYARNANIGLAACTSDAYLVNDDCLFTHPYTLEIMQNVLSQHPEVGVLSPRILGDVGEYTQGHFEGTLKTTEVRLCYVAVMLRREVLDKVGLLDEKFVGYGGEDVSHCRDIVNAGYKLGVTGKAVVKHGFGDMRRSASYNRQEYGTIEQLDKIAMDYYESKYGDRSIVCK
jgi:hypothetical protein